MQKVFITYDRKDLIRLVCSLYRYYTMYDYFSYMKLNENSNASRVLEAIIYDDDSLSHFLLVICKELRVEYANSFYEREQVIINNIEREFKYDRLIDKVMEIDKINEKNDIEWGESKVRWCDRDWNYKWVHYRHSDLKLIDEGRGYEYIKKYMPSSKGAIPYIKIVSMSKGKWEN